MSIDDDIACLQAVPTFSLLGPHALRILAIGCETRALAQGEVLFQAGEPADCGYVVRDGAFRLELAAAERAHPAAEGHQVTTIGPGGLLGELALIVDMARPVTATAIEPATVMRISRHLFRKTLEGFPDAAERLRDHMAARTRQVAAEIAQIGAALAMPADLPQE